MEKEQHISTEETMSEPLKIYLRDRSRFSVRRKKRNWGKGARQAMSRRSEDWRREISVWLFHLRSVIPEEACSLWL